MSRIISYPYDNDIKDADAWIGSEASTTRTKQYTAQAVANYLNINGKISIGGQMTYQYVQNPLQGAGTFSITSGGLDNVPFANITALTLSITDKVGQNVVAFLDYLVGSDILISKQNEVSSFGHYGVVSYVVSPINPAFYNLVVDLKGSNGSMNFLDIYEAINFTLASEIVGSYTFNVDSDNGTTTPIQNNDTINFGSSNITVSNVGSAISFNLPVTGVTAGAYTTANITVDAFGRVTEAASGTSGPGGTGTTNFVTKWTNGTTLGDSIIFDNGTNVGIGTTNPSSILHLKSNTSTLTLESSDTTLDPDQVWASLDFKQNDGSQTPTGSVANISAVSKAGNTNFGNLLFQTKSRPADAYNDTLFLSSSGNAGIGTTSPSEKLEVIGTIKANSVKVVASTTTTELTTEQYVPIKVVNTGGYAHARINGIEVGGNTSSSNEGYIKTQDNSRKLFLDTNGWRFSQSNTEFMRLTSDGKLGIGTTNPNSKLHIESSISNGSVFRITTSTSGALQPVFNADIIANGDTVFDLGNYKDATKKIQIKSANTSYIQQVDGSGGFDIKGYLKTSLQTVNGGGVLQLHRYGALSLNDDASYAHTPSSALYINTLYNTSTDYLMVLADEGNDKLVVDLNGNVGIGTTSPTAKLHLSDSASGGNPSFIIQDNARSGAAALNYISLKDSLNATQAKIGYLSSLNTELTFQNLVGNTDLVSSSQLKVAAGTNIIFSNSGTEKMRIIASGNVGIGTTSPTSKLQIKGLVTDSNPLVLIENYDNGGISSSLTVKGANSASSATIDLDRSVTGRISGIRYITSGTTNFFSGIFYNGGNAQSNFGIGTDRDISNQKLVITPTGSIKFNAYGAGTLVTDASGNITASSGGGVGGPFLPLAGGTMTGNVIVPGIGVGNSTVYSNSINLNNLGTFRIGNAEFLAKSSNDLNIYQGRMLVTSAGNVGIGTTNPGYKFEVNSGTVNNIAKFVSTDLGGVITVKDSGGEVGFSNVGDNIFFKTSSSQINQMSILNSGNVGIGTNTPSEKLHVFGGAAVIKIDSTTNEASLKYDNSTTTAAIKLANNDLKTELGGSEKMRILANGNVGIGTTSPGYKLEVATSLAVTFGAASMIRINKESLGDIGITAPKIYSGETIGFQSNNATTSFNFAYANTSLVTMKSAGNVGIGTTSPSANLHIKSGSAGTYTPSTLADELLLESVNSGGVTLLTPSAFNSSIIFGSPDRQIGSRITWNYDSLLMNVGTATANANLAFKAGNDSEKMRIIANGNVGIGTTNPQAKLDVNGPIKVGTAQTVAATSANVGSIRYRAGSNNSYMEMVMQTGAGVGDFAWVIIKENTW